jgi:tetratricopeptide (TPR) repeat protein
MISGRVKIILYFSCLLAATPLPAAGKPGLVQQGTAAFQRGAYSEALDFFTRAEQAGRGTRTVDYNIAVCLYRLQRFKEAELRFIKLSKHAKWRDLAHYNLGLTAEAAGRHEDAGKWYRLAAEGPTEKLRQLAERKLAQLQAARAGREWMTLLSFSLGRDSNAASLADEMQAAAGADDNYSEWLAYGQRYLQGRAGAGLKFYALGFDRSHRDLNSLDSQVAGLGLVKELAWRKFQAEAGIRLTRTLVDSNVLADQLQASVSLTRPLAGGGWSLAYLPSRYFSGDRYSQIEGWQQHLETNWTRRFDAWTLETRYRFETNDREDLRRDDSFSSYSPVRNGIMGKLDRKLSDAFNLTLALEYTRAHYSGENRLRDTDGAIKQTARSNEQARVTAGCGYRWGAGWRLKGEYEYIDTKDSFDLYTFDKNRLNATVEYQF